MAKATIELRQRHRPAGADADDDVPARARLRGLHRRAVLRRRWRGVIVVVAARAAARPALRLRQARDRDAGSQRGHPGRGARAARHHRTAVRAGRPAQAAGRRDRDLDAERVRDGPLARRHHGVRDARHPRPALPRRARRRDGARAHARDQPRRDGDDAGELLRHAGLDDRPVRAVLRRRLRQPRRGGGHHDRAARLGDRYAVSFLLLRALSRYREFAADRGSAVLTGPPQRARLGAAEDQRHDRAACPRRTCAGPKG